MRPLLRLVDLLTTLGAGAATVCVGAVAFSYCFEVVSRYFFDAPTTWVSAVTTYLLLAAVMLMFPYVTRERGHIAITFLIERLGPRYGRWLSIACILVSAVVCILSIWFTGEEVHRQFVRDVRMLDTMLVPKWWLSVWFIFGFAGASIHFLQHAVGPDAGATGPTPALEA